MGFFSLKFTFFEILVGGSFVSKVLILPNFPHFIFLLWANSDELCRYPTPQVLHQKRILPNRFTLCSSYMWNTWDCFVPKLALQMLHLKIDFGWASDRWFLIASVVANSSLQMWHEWKYLLRLSDQIFLWNLRCFFRLQAVLKNKPQILQEGISTSVCFFEWIFSNILLAQTTPHVLQGNWNIKV